MIAGTSDSDFYPVWGLCRATRVHIMHMASTERYLFDGCWYVHGAALPLLFKLAKSTGHHQTLDYSNLPPDIVVNIERALGKHSRTYSAHNAEHYAVLHLLPTAPPAIVKAAYKHLCLEHHPDRGGDAERFKVIQNAYAKIQSGYDS